MIKSSRVGAMLDLVGDSARADSTRTAAEAFGVRIGQVLALDTDYAVYCEHAAEDDRPLRISTSPGFTPGSGTCQILCAYARTDPWLSYVRRTGRPVAARWSDVAGTEELGRNPLVQQLYRPAGTNQVLHAPIVWGPDTNIMVTVSR